MTGKVVTNSEVKQSPRDLEETTWRLLRHFAPAGAQFLAMTHKKTDG